MNDMLPEKAEMSAILGDDADGNTERDCHKRVRIYFRHVFGFSVL
jgi:hypothetical protein